MTTETLEALEGIEAAANQAIEDYEAMGWRDEAQRVTELLDVVLDAAHELDQRHFLALGLSAEEADDE